MAVCHDESIVAYYGASACCGTAVYSDAFAEGGVVADDGKRLFSAEFQVLRDGAYHCTGKDGAVFADTGALKDCDVAADACSLANLYVLVDRDKWIDYYAWSDFGGGVHVCQWLFHTLNPE